MTWAKLTLVRSGKAGVARSRGRCAARSTASASSVKKRNAGCPCRRPPARRPGAARADPPRASGMSRPVSSGGPMLTESPCPHPPPPAPHARADRHPVFPVRLITMAATQRVALPQAPRCCHRHCRRPATDRPSSCRPITASWSNPTPRCRSASKAASGGVTSPPARARLPASSTTKSLPSPCIFMKGKLRGASCSMPAHIRLRPRFEIPKGRFPLDAQWPRQ